MFICPADDSGPNILNALGRENVQRAGLHGVHSSYVGLLSDLCRAKRAVNKKAFSFTADKDGQERTFILIAGDICRLSNLKP